MICTRKALNLFPCRMSNLIHCRAAIHLILLCAHLPGIPSLLFKISPELQVLTCDRILPDMRQKEECQTGAEDAESAAHEEGILAASVAVRATWSVLLNDGENVGSDESANLPHGSGDGIVLATDGGGTGFGRDQTNVITGSCFAEGEEDAVDDDEATYCASFVEVRIAAGHDKAYDTLGQDE